VGGSGVIVTALEGPWGNPVASVGHAPVVGASVPVGLGGADGKPKTEYAGGQSKNDASHRKLLWE
jgi:hypothetical protein